MINSRAKGRSFELQIAKILHDELGCKFYRDLEQYRSVDRGDLITDDLDFPFIVECKAYKSGNKCDPDWQRQASRAAIAASKMPVVIYKFNYRDITCSVPMEVINPAYAKCGFWADISMDAFCYLAREYMGQEQDYKF